jgi:hypothetical protein
VLTTEQRGHRVDGLRVLHGPRQLRPETEEKGHLVPGIGLVCRLPGHQHPQELAVVYERCAKKAAVAPMGSVSRQAAVGMGAGIGVDDQFLPLRHETHEAFSESDPDAADRVRGQSFRGCQDAVLLFHIGQIDGAGVDGYGLLHLPDDDCQGVVQGRRSTDLLHDLPQGDKHGANLLNFPGNVGRAHREKRPGQTSVGASVVCRAIWDSDGSSRRKTAHHHEIQSKSGNEAIRCRHVEIESAT